MNKVTLIIIICTIIFMVLALYWESQDILRISKLPNVYDINNPEKKEKAYIFYGTFSYENTVVWRHIYIGAIISTVLIYYVLTSSKFPISLEIGLAIFFLIFFIFYYISNFRSFHIWRVIASKVQPAIII